MGSLVRNRRCPCGSGLKYKRCCEPLDKVGEGIRMTPVGGGLFHVAIPLDVFGGLAGGPGDCLPDELPSLPSYEDVFEVRDPEAARWLAKLPGVVLLESDGPANLYMIQLGVFDPEFAMASLENGLLTAWSPDAVLADRVRWRLERGLGFRIAWLRREEPAAAAS